MQSLILQEFFRPLPWGSLVKSRFLPGPGSSPVVARAPRGTAVLRLQA
jgi:hypothetical protein